MKYLLMLLVSFFLMQFPAPANAEEGTRCDFSDISSPYGKWCGEWRGEMIHSRATIGLKVTYVDNEEVYGEYSWRGKTWVLNGYTGVASIEGNKLTVKWPGYRVEAIFELKANRELSLSYCSDVTECSPPARGRLKYVTASSPKKVSTNQ